MPAAVARVLESKGMRLPSLKSEVVPASTTSAGLTGLTALPRLLEMLTLPVPLVPGVVLLASGLVPVVGPSPPPLGVTGCPRADIHSRGSAV